MIATSRDGDTDFWTRDELAEPATYVSKAAVSRRFAGRGIGALMLRWVCDHAAADGSQWVRLDVWKTNRELQSYYRRQGWTYLRTVEAPGRNSGALFQRQAEPDPEARAAFALRTATTTPSLPIDPGSPVIVAAADGPVAATVVEVFRDWSEDVAATRWERDSEGDGPPPVYTVEREGRRFTAFVDDVSPDPTMVRVSSSGHL